MLVLLAIFYVGHSRSSTSGLKKFMAFISSLRPVQPREFLMPTLRAISWIPSGFVSVGSCLRSAGKVCSLAPHQPLTNVHSQLTGCPFGKSADKFMAKCLEERR